MFVSRASKLAMIALVDLAARDTNQPLPAGSTSRSSHLIPGSVSRVKVIPHAPDVQRIQLNFSLEAGPGTWPGAANEGHVEPMPRI